MRAERRRARHPRLERARRAEPVPGARPGRRRAAARGQAGPVHRAARARRHEVVVNAPDPVTCSRELSVEQVAAAMDVWRERMRAHAEHAAYVHVIVNERREAGASLPHTHAQIYALDFVPAAVARERERFAAYAAADDGRQPAPGPRRRRRSAAASGSSRSTTRRCSWSPYGARAALPAAARPAPAPRRASRTTAPTGAALLHDGLTRLARAARREPAAEPVGAHRPARRRPLLLADRRRPAPDAPRRPRARHRRAPQHRRARAGRRRAARGVMRALVQRVSRAAVRVDGETVGGDRRRACSCCSASRTTTPRRRPTASPTRSARCAIFPDADGRMNEPLGEREVLCVSQFTLYGDARRGNRPSYVAAAPARAGRAALRALLRAPRRRAAACSARTWRSSSSTTGRSRCCSSVAASHTTRPSRSASRTRPAAASRSRWPSTSREDDVGVGERQVGPQVRGESRARCAAPSTARRIRCARRACMAIRRSASVAVGGERLAVAGSTTSTRRSPRSPRSESSEVDERARAGAGRRRRRRGRGRRSARAPNGARGRCARAGGRRRPSSAVSRVVEARCRSGCGRGGRSTRAPAPATTSPPGASSSSTLQPPEKCAEAARDTVDGRTVPASMPWRGMSPARRRRRGPCAPRSRAGTRPASAIAATARAGALAHRRRPGRRGRGAGG